MRKKTILLTGGSGLVGQNFLETAKNYNFDIIAPSSDVLNLLTYDTVKNYILKKNPDYILHAAGKVGGIQANIREPVKFLDTNMVIGRNIIMAAYECGVKNFINLGSTCMYPANAKNPLSESDILTGELEPTNEGYAIAKITTLKLCEYINRENKRYSYKTIIPCNLYGKYDKFQPHVSHLVPAIIQKIHKAKSNFESEVTIWGDGSARREFMFAKDFTQGLCEAIVNFERLPNIINFGLGYDYSVLEYYKVVAEVIGWQGKFDFDLTKPSGMRQKLCDVTKQKNFGWNPSTELQDGVRESYKYYLHEVLQ